MKKIAIVLFGLMFLQVNAQTTTFNINRNLSCSDIVRPFYGNTRSYGISINGEGQLFSDTAFIMVVLVDNNNHEWLVYERNSLESLDLQGLAPGTYTMRVTLENGKAFSDKVVKE